MFWIYLSCFPVLLVIFLILGYWGDRLVERNPARSVSFDRLHFGVFLTILVYLGILIVQCVVWMLKWLI